jgi:hypothetical protein
MTTRNFIQYGQAYGSTPASITATIDGTVVFSGPVTTVDLPLPGRGNTSVSDLPTLFTWTNTVEFVGAQSFSIAVTGCQLVLDCTAADNTAANSISEFCSFYKQTIGNVTVYDPFTNVTIDGMAMQRGPNNDELSGQWQWLIPAGSTFTATLNVDAGFLPPPA